MNKLDDLLARIKLLIPSAQITTDMHHERHQQAHWAAVRVAHGLLLIAWTPGEAFRMLLDSDKEEHLHKQFEGGEDVHEALDFIVKFVIRRGLV